MSRFAKLREKTRSFIGTAAIAGVLCLGSGFVNPAYANNGNGNSNGNSNENGGGAPEIDLSTGAAGVALLAAGTIFILDRRKNLASSDG